MNARWPVFARLYSDSLIYGPGCVWISARYDFKMHSRGNISWFSRGGRAIIMGPLDELGVEWLDQYEAQLAHACRARPKIRGGRFPAASALAGLERSGSTYFTPIDRYNVNKPLSAKRLCALEENCARVLLIWEILPMPIAEELAPAFVYNLPASNMLG
jgi:hypothetical protein